MEIIIKDTNKIIRIDSLFDIDGNKVVTCPATQQKCDYIYDNLSYAVINKNVDKSYLDMISVFSTYWIIGDKIYLYLNAYKEYIINLKFKEIKLVDQKNNIVDGKYYIVLPKKIILKDDVENHTGLFYANEVFENKDYLRTMYLNYEDFDPEFYSLKLMVKGKFKNIFLNQRIKGIELSGRTKKKDPVWFISDKASVKDRLEDWFLELSKDKFVKSRCKYIYFTIIEETDCFNITIAGYMNKCFTDETFVFAKDYCNLRSTELDAMTYNKALSYLRDLLNKIYNKHDYDFVQVDAFIGYHDGEILKIN